LRIDPREVQAFVDGKSAALTPTEFKLLYTLALDRGRVVSEIIPKDMSVIELTEYLIELQHKAG